MDSTDHDSTDHDSTGTGLTDHRAPCARRRKFRGHGGLAAIVVAVIGGLVGSGVLVWNASYAAFSGSTSNAGNNWSAGSVALTDDDTGSAMFSGE